MHNHDHLHHHHHHLAKLLQRVSKMKVFPPEEHLDSLDFLVNVVGRKGGKKIQQSYFDLLRQQVVPGVEAEELVKDLFVLVKFCGQVDQLFAKKNLLHTTVITIIILVLIFIFDKKSLVTKYFSWCPLNLNAMSAPLGPVVVEDGPFLFFF